MIKMWSFCFHSTRYDNNLQELIASNEPPRELQIADEYAIVK